MWFPWSCLQTLQVPTEEHRSFCTHLWNREVMNNGKVQGRWEHTGGIPNPERGILSETCKG